MGDQLKKQQNEAFLNLLKKHNIDEDTINVEFIVSIVRDILKNPEQFGLQPIQV